MMCSAQCGLEFEFIKNKNSLFPIYCNVSKTLYSQHMNNTGTCPDTDSQLCDFLKCAKSKQLIRELISYKTSTCIALISDRHLSPPTLCIYPALATCHGICNRHEPACQIDGKVNLPREQKLTKTNKLKITKMATSDYVLLAPSGDYIQNYNQTISGITFSRTFTNIAINSRTFEGT